MKRIIKFIGKRIAYKLLPPPLRIAAGVSGYLYAFLRKRHNNTRN
ncbi:MAG: hypothetical protein AB1400_01280 [Pseudomonadota bacterium]